MNKTTKIILCIAPDDKLAFEADAKEGGLTLSAHIRRLLERESTNLQRFRLKNKLSYE